MDAPCLPEAPVRLNAAVILPANQLMVRNAVRAFLYSIAGAAYDLEEMMFVASIDGEEFTFWPDTLIAGTENLLIAENTINNNMTANNMTRYCIVLEFSYVNLVTSTYQPRQYVVVTDDSPHSLEIYL